MNKDTAEQLLNDQEDAIAELKVKLSEMEDDRDIATGKALELVKAMRRIECAYRTSTGSETIGEIARRAIDAFSEK